MNYLDLEMIEKQKELRDLFDVQVLPNCESKECWFVKVLFPDIMSPYYEIPNEIEASSYEEALKMGVDIAIKNLKP